MGRPRPQGHEARDEDGDESDDAPRKRARVDDLEAEALRLLGA